MIETKISVIRTIKDGTKTFRRWTMDELFRELRGERYCSVLLSTTDINMKVGRLMKQIGFEQVRARIGRCYKVARAS